MDFGLQDRVALITGGSKGIGRAAAERFASEQAAVAVTFHSDQSSAEAVVSALQAHGTRAMAVPMDLSSAASIQKAVAAILDRWSRIDVLVNNAVDWPRNGTVPPTRFERTEHAAWSRLLSANVHGPLTVVQAVLPAMRATGWGRIVNISSRAADEGMPGYGWYAVAKAALHGLTRTLARELTDQGILVNTILAGPTLTERLRTETPPRMLEHWGQTTGLRRMAEPDEVARAILFLGSAANTVISGEAVRIGGLEAGRAHARE